MSRLHYFIVLQPIKKTFTFSPVQIHQILRVLRLKPHNRVVCIYSGRHYLTRLEYEHDRLVGRIIALLPAAQPPMLKITVIVSLIKPRAWKLMLQKLAELGVSKIVPFISQNSVFKRSDQFNQLIVKWQKICDEATEQAQNYNRCLVQSVCDRIGDLTIYRRQLNLVLDLTSEQKLVPTLTIRTFSSIPQIVLVVGPEGGLTRVELDSLSALGFVRVGLGPRTLRTETAAIYACAVIDSYINQMFN